jgi:UDP-galactopyranose mutase
MNKSEQILIIGAGFSGAVVAYELAEAGYMVSVIEHRDHIGGNAYDFINEHGIRVHKYGPHLFHTSNQKVVTWLSQFTDWIPYQHKVKALLKDGRYVTLPVNKETAAIVGTNNVISTFYRPYTKKMWGVELEELNPEIIQRVPIRDDLNEFYFPSDTFQAMPKEGYTAIFKRMLSHPRIEVVLNQSFSKDMEPGFKHIFNSMPIDLYFDNVFGELPYRSIKFHHQHIPIPSLLPTATVNFTHDHQYTRVTEWKKLPNHGSNDLMTTLTFEEPCDYKDNHLERYYPIKDLDGANLARYQQYKGLVPKHMHFIGRCGLYAYLDMHQAISSSLSIAREFISMNSTI